MSNMIKPNFVEFTGDGEVVQEHSSEAWYIISPVEGIYIDFGDDIGLPVFSEDSGGAGITITTEQLAELGYVKKGGGALDHNSEDRS